MHSVLEGVAKTLFSFWFEKALGPYSLKDKITDLNTILLSMRPPSYVANPPRSLKEWKLWKANDFLTFFLFYSNIVFRGIMSLEHYSHLLNFTLGLEYLLAPSIDRNALGTVQKLLEDFVSDFGSLYDDQVYSSGTHELLHLVECTLKFGPLNSTNGFPFEEINRKIVNLIHGRDLMGEEFIQMFSVAQALTFFHSRIEFQNPQLYDFFNSHFFIKTSNRKHWNNQEGLVIKCSIKQDDISSYSAILER